MPKRNHRSAVAIYDAQSNIFFVFVVRHHALFIVGGNSAPNSVKHTWSETSSGGSNPAGRCGLSARIARGSDPSSILFLLAVSG